MPPPPRQKAPKGFRSSGTLPSDTISDPRFANIQTDPKFRLPSRKNTHVQIDKRFAHMLRDEAFSSRAKVDRYGRTLPKEAGKKELERYYRIEDEGPDGEADEDDEVEAELRRANAEDEEMPSSSSDESSSEDDSLEEAEGQEVFGMLEEQEGDVPMGELTSRIAVVNLDWDNIRAADLMAVFSSFTPGNGRILKISVYPSEFGRERMEREEMEGPPGEIFAQSRPNRQEDDASSSSGDDEDDILDDDDENIKKSLLKEDSGHEFNSAKLRRYQLERLRYFYAVLTCSSKEVAQTIYEAVDGTEYLTTANFFDLRFIPDDTDFSDDKPRDECERIPDGYKPNEFVTDALQHSKVRLTWDADDVTRKEAQKKAFSGSRADIDENDLKAYLGSDSSDDEAPEPVVVDATSTRPANDQPTADTAKPDLKLSKKDAERQRMRSLLGLQGEPATKRKSKAEKSAPVGDMQITFSSGLTSEPNKGSVFENEPEREETTVEKYVRREKERKSKRKEKLKATRTTAEPGANHADDTEAAGPETKEVGQDLGFSDPFFTAPSTVKKPKSSKPAKPVLDPDQRAELELLVQDDTASTIKHFDLTTLAKAEKAALKKKKKRKLSGREKEALEQKGKDEFQMDVRDPRFGAVFERSEFAIDPSHPRFKGTGGMRELLEEGRKRRRDGDGDGDDEGGERGGDGDGEDLGKKGKRKKAVDYFEGEGEDVTKLVARVKGKVRRD